MNYLITGVGLILASLFFGMNFFVPRANVRALTKGDIYDYNIHFVSAKTNVRQAVGYDKVLLSEDDQVLANPEFYSYAYDYTSSDPNFYYSSPVKGSDTLGQLELTSNNANLPVYTPYTYASYPKNNYIPSEVTHFANAEGNLENIFYNEIDNGDFVLLNNYDKIQNDPFNVENFYLGFGSTYDDETNPSTPLASLRVSARLHTQDRVHLLVVNEPSSKKLNDSDVYARFWSQYLDLTNLTAKQSADPISPTYDVSNTEGRYEFTFYFIRYDKDMQPVSVKEEEFTYSFYLLDGTTYAEYPEVNGAELGALNFNSTNEYFYNYTETDRPTISYNPSLYNLSYTRDFRDIAESITSTFSTGVYEIDGKSYPKGIISYYNGNTLVKEVTILVYYNADKTMIEYMYLANYSGSPRSASTLSAYMTLLSSKSLSFEYKTTAILSTSVVGEKTTFTTDTFKTVKYDNHYFNLLLSDNFNDEILISSKVFVYEDGAYYIDSVSQSNKIYDLTATISSQLLPAITTTDDGETGGVILKNADLSTTPTLDGNSVRYYLDTLNQLFRVKSGESAQLIVQLDTTSTGNFMLKFNNLDIFYTVDQDNAISSVIFAYNHYLKASGFSQSTNGSNLKSLINIDTLSVQYSYNLSFDELGIYNFSYAYVSCAYNNTLGNDNFTNEYIVNNTTNSSNILTPVNYANDSQLINQLSSTNGVTIKIDDLSVINTFNSASVRYQLNGNVFNIRNYGDADFVALDTVDIDSVGIKNIIDNVNGITIYYQVENIDSQNIVTKVYFQRTTLATKDMELSVYGYINANNQVTLHGTTYTYNASAKTISFGVSTISLENNRSALADITIGDATLQGYYSISTSLSGIRLSITYIIGTYSVSSQVVSYLYSISDKIARDHRQQTDTHIFKLNLSETDLLADKLSTFRQVITQIKDYEFDGATSTYYYSISQNLTTGYVQGKDKLHIFGSIAYFNKQDSTTDSGYAKLENIYVEQSLIDESKYNDISLISDVTANYIDIQKSINPAFATQFNKSGLNQSFAVSNFKGFSESLIGTGDNQIDASDLIVTNITPTLWRNFSNLMYVNNNKIAMSYIFRYINYKINSDGTIALGDKIETSIFTKDTYAQFDGLYEIVVIYTYDNYKNIDPNKSSDQVFFQLFTFIIDNSSPKLTIEALDTKDTETTDDDEYLSLDQKYTNKDIRLSWDVPSYFSNNVYIGIDKTYFTADNTTYNFSAIYRNNTVTVSNGNSAYVNAITKTELKGNKYFVYISLPINNPQNYTLNGNYKITLYYGNNGGSSISEQFVLDRINIAGTTILPIIERDGDGKYYVNSDKNFGTNQIINSAFTFIYNQKASGAKIQTYYHKIDSISHNDYDKLITSDNGLQGVTTMVIANGKSSEINSFKEYIYNHNIPATNYAHSSVYSSNVFNPSTSGLYLFRLKDEAGNECRYVVFYDNISPRFITSPTPTGNADIVNDITRTLWGDYKAVKISTNLGYSLDLTTSIDNYTKLSSNDRLTETLQYINSSNKFNSTKVEKIGDDYYFLIPLDKAQIEDQSSQNYIQLKNGEKQFYFFPSDPVFADGSDLKITLPVYNADGTVTYQPDTSTLVKESYRVIGTPTYTPVTNAYGQTIERYITLTYFDGTKNVTISGTIGEGIYVYSIFDKLGNSSSSRVWMNLDKTQMLAYASFDYTESMKNIVPLPTHHLGTTYSATRLYLTSLASTVENKIYNHDVTYKYFPYSANFYNNYTVTNIEIENGVLNETFLVLSMKHNTNLNEPVKTVRMQLTDEDGNYYPLHSYPYDLEGSAIVSDTSGNPKDVYLTETSSYKLSGDPDRRFTTTINPVSDTSMGKIVTQEGLYVFKRTYTDEELNLGTDSRIVYRVYYVDRNGIINITSAGSIADNLYNIGESIGFELGSTSTNNDYKKAISPETIQNNQTNNSLGTSNSNFSSKDLFTTNKIQVEFNLAYDKYDFSKFYQNFYNSFASIASGQTENINTFIFNSNYFKNLYKVDLKLTKDSTKVIDETGVDIDNKFPTASTYLKGIWQVGGTRTNNINMFYGGVYNITLIDHAGYFRTDSMGKSDPNYLANKLEISFKINHIAPQGETYGKYYGQTNYDEGTATNPSVPIQTPTEIDNTLNLKYALLNKYLDGNLKPLSESTAKSTTTSMNGSHVKLYSTNNETLVFVFSITNDSYLAQIDPNNVKVYKGGTNASNLIFNRINGTNNATALVTKERMNNAYIKNTIGDTTYYAIVVFDNNLDDIVNRTDPNEQEFLNYRLLDANQNSDQETYYIQINYVGNASDYIGVDGNKEISFYTTTYETVVDRNKPTYNLTKLMTKDKYVFNTAITNVTTSNYETVFGTYKPFYNFSLDTEHGIERSDLENYFFAIDYRTDSSFVFESISELDNAKSFYIKKVNLDTYKYSITPDDYKAYYDSIFIQGHPQFTPSKAITITTTDLNRGISLLESNYYKVNFSLNQASNDNFISANYLFNKGIFVENGYYEIIEGDEAGNYRVYGVYVPQYKTNKLTYKYQLNSNPASARTVSLEYGNNPVVKDVSGMKLEIPNNGYITSDYFVKAQIAVDSVKLKETKLVYYHPSTKQLIVTRLSNNTQVVVSSTTIDAYDNYRNRFSDKINEILNDYYTIISDKSSAYYTQFGYTINLTVVDRIGIVVLNSLNTLYNYEIAYNVAGSVLDPVFTNASTQFTIAVPKMTGSTYITQIRVYKFNTVWTPIDVDSQNNSFSKSYSELMNGFTYVLGRGVFKFELTDNFARTNTYFHEFGIASSQTGGSFYYRGIYQNKPDGFTYTGQTVEYSYDSSIYDIYIKFMGEAINIESPDHEYAYTEKIVYSTAQSYSEDERLLYGISSVTTLGSITTITFVGVKDISKYHIKTILASTASNYVWDSETTNKNIFVYDKKVAIATIIPTVTIRNLNGTELLLDPNEHLHLTEDFELKLIWKDTSILPINRIDFNAKIILKSGSETISVSDGYIITTAGEYSAQVINDLGTVSDTIVFTRGAGEISMYAIYAVDKTTKTEQSLDPSNYIESEESDGGKKVVFNYFTSDKFFSYMDSRDKVAITANTIINYNHLPDLASVFVPNTAKNQYLDVRVNSNLNIYTEIFKVGLNGPYPFVQYRIYSKNLNDDSYTYRFIKITFVNQADTKLSDIVITNSGSSTNIMSSTTVTIPSNATSMLVEFKFKDNTGLMFSPIGDTLFIDRYFNGTLAETIVVDTSNAELLNSRKFTLSSVGLHQFAIRDLAGRTHRFGPLNNQKTMLQIYLINEVMYKVNNATPINNQIFNSQVKVNIISELSGLKLYDTRSLGITVFKNGKEISAGSTTGELVFDSVGYYSIKMTATTSLSDSSTIVADQEISSVYNFAIVSQNIALRSFNVSAGAGFTIDRILKIVGRETYDLSNNASYKNKDSLWLTFTDQGNSIFDITLKVFDSALQNYRTFNFRVWVNEEMPVIESNVDEGSATTGNITLNLNPGLIYSQVGKCYVQINGQTLYTIDDNSDIAIETISIAQKGTYWVQIISEDGTLIGSYKYVKNDPISGTGQIIIFSAIAGVIVLVILFVLIRRKGKYR